MEKSTAACMCHMQGAGRCNACIHVCMHARVGGVRACGRKANPHTPSLSCTFRTTQTNSPARPPLEQHIANLCKFITRAIVQPHARILDQAWIVRRVNSEVSTPP